MNSSGKVRFDFLKNVATLISGSSLAQAIGLGLSFVITRLYSPEQFATLEQFAMIMAIVGVVVTGKYEFAILLPAEEKKAKSLQSLALRITLVISIIVGAIAVIFGTSISEYYNNPELNRALWLL
ncbi:MAG: oligosaccharide flippase family protein, partial [Bacteroidota bacterium]